MIVKEEHRDSPSPAGPHRCQARTRRGPQCRRLALRGGWFCPLHGRQTRALTPPDSDFQNPDQPALIPFRARDRLDEVLKVQGLSKEIAWVRILMDHAMQQEVPPPMADMCRALDALSRALRAQYGMSNEGHDTLAGSIAATLERLAAQMGLQEAWR